MVDTVAGVEELFRILAGVLVALILWVVPEDVLDYTSSELGAGMPLRRSAADMGDVAEEGVRQSEVTHPGREFRTEPRGDLAGEWDLNGSGRSITV